MSADPFATRALRDATLEAWLRSPTRLLEDTNAEAELAREGYRDAVVWELLQNACDAAQGTAERRAWVRLVDGSTPYLEVANTGTPLDAQGVASLASLRASAKGVDATGAGPAPIGRFGVGFAAVRAVSDEIEIRTCTEAGQWHGVRFSATALHDTLSEAAAENPQVQHVLQRLGQSLPALRWPEPLTGAPEGCPASAVTVVRVTLRGQDEVSRVRRQIAKFDERLLFALPLNALDLDGTEVTRDALESRWHWFDAVAEVGADENSPGRSDPAARVLWAVPRDGEYAAGQATIWAPTPTRDDLPLTALLVADFPVNAMREHVLDVPAAHRLARAAGEALARFAESLTAEGHNSLALRLMPRGVAPHTVAATLYESANTAFRGARLVPVIGGGHVVGPDACAIDGSLARDPGFADLAGSAGFTHLTTLSADEGIALRLGVERLALADIIEQLPTGDVDWQERFRVLAAHEGELRASDALGALAIPLADGRVVRGCRGVVRLVGETSTDPYFDERAESHLELGPDHVDFLQQFGLRVLEPTAFHPLLERLGVARLSVASALEGELGQAVAAEVQRHFEEGDEDEAEALSAAVLGLVRSAEHSLGSSGWRLGQALPTRRLHLLNLVVEDTEGELAPLRNVCLPGAAALVAYEADWLTEASDAALAEFGDVALTWCGASTQLPQIDLTAELEARPDEILDHLSDDLEDEVADCREWLEATLAKGERPHPLALRDAHQVRDEAWPDVLQHLAQADRSGASGARYESWWLSEVVLEGARLVPPTPTAARWYAQVEDVGLALKLVPGWAAPLTRSPALRGDFDHDIGTALARFSRDDLMQALGTPPEDLDGTLDPRLIVALWRGALRASSEAGQDFPEDVWILDAAGIATYANCEDVSVAPHPMWLQRSDLGYLVCVPEQSEELAPDLGLGSISTETPCDLVWSPGSSRRANQVEERLRAVEYALELAGVTVPTRPDVKVCESLQCEGSPVEWWVEDAAVPRVYATTDLGLAQGLAQALDQWSYRYAIAAVLSGLESPEGMALG